MCVCMCVYVCVCVLFSRRFHYLKKKAELKENIHLWRNTWQENVNPSFHGERLPR